MNFSRMGVKRRKRNEYYSVLSGRQLYTRLAGTKVALSRHNGKTAAAPTTTARIYLYAAIRLSFAHDQKLVGRQLKRFSDGPFSLSLLT